MGERATERDSGPEKFGEMWIEISTISGSVNLELRMFSPACGEGVQHLTGYRKGELKEPGEVPADLLAHVGKGAESRPSSLDPTSKDRAVRTLIDSLQAVDRGVSD